MLGGVNKGGRIALDGMATLGVIVRDIHEDELDSCEGVKGNADGSPSCVVLQEFWERKVPRSDIVETELTLLLEAVETLLVTVVAQGEWMEEDVVVAVT